MPRQKPLAKAAELVPGLARRPESVKRDRREDEGGQTWDERNRPATLRIRAEDHNRLEAQARALGLSKDALGAALLWAGLDALDAGLLALEVETVESEVTDSKGRRRFYVRRQARPSWQSSAVPARDDSTG
jgi:hypothetical protein